MKLKRVMFGFCCVCLSLLVVLPAHAADIASYEQAADRAVAQLVEDQGDLMDFYGNPTLLQGPIDVVAGATTLRMGQGAGWLFALRFTKPAKPLYYLAFVHEDASVDVQTAKALPAGLVAVPLQGADSTTAGAVSTREQAYALLLRALLGHSEQGRRIYAAQSQITTATATVATWNGDVTLSGGPGWLFFVDDVPTANWAHPCRYVLVSEDGSLHVEKWSTPPKDMAAFAELTSWTDAALRTPTSASATDPFESLPAAATPAANRHAVIISGGYNQYSNYSRYWNDCAFFFITLKKYGFLDENIHVLFADGTDPGVDRPDGSSSPLDFDGDGTPDIEYSATKANIALVFNNLAAKLGSDDILYVFATDHGGAESSNLYPYWSPDVVLYLWGEYITADALASEFDKVKPKAVAAIFEQCFSGGMVEKLAAPNRVIMSASRWWELSYAKAPDYAYDEFSYYATLALHTPVVGDSNGDEISTMEEAYLYALANDSRQSEVLTPSLDNAGEHPSYSSTPWNLGRRLSLWGFDEKLLAPVYAGYVQTDPGEDYPDVGEAQGWNADDGLWKYDLPFTFPFAGKNYTSVNVSSNGILYFGAPQTGGRNSVNGLAASQAIAPLWDDLTTEYGGLDIYIKAASEYVTFAWDAVAYVDSISVTPAVRLYRDGSFTLYYSSGNDLIGRLPQRDKTIGMSGMDGMHLSLDNGAPYLEYISKHFRPAAAPVPAQVLLAPPAAGAEAVFVAPEMRN